MSGAGDWQALAEIRVLRQKMRLAAEMIQQVSKLACQDLVRIDVIWPIVQPYPAVAVQQYSIVGVRQVLGRQPKIESMAGQLCGSKARQQVMRLALEHRRVRFTEHLDMAERKSVIRIAEIEVV